MRKANAAPVLGDKNGKTTDSKYSENNSDSYRIKFLLCKTFREGGRYTARDLNIITGQNDARKRISELRREGMNIKSIWLDKPRCKIYWLEPDDHPTLFGEEVCNG